MRTAVLVLMLLLARPAAARVPEVVADIAPVHALAALVMGDLGKPTLLLDGASDPHEVHMRPSQARRLAAADLVVWIGPELTPWLAGALETLGPGARSRPLLRAGVLAMSIGDDGVARLPDARLFRTDPVAVPPASAPAPDQPRGLAATDPHAWLDPANAAAFVQVIAGDLIALDPGNAARYAANARAAVAGLRVLDHDLRQRLAAAPDVTLLPYHDAYRYFLERYGLAAFATVTDSSATPPGAGRLRRLRDRLRDAPPGCVLVEPGRPGRLMRSIDPGQRLRVVVIDPLGATLRPGPDLYDRLIRGLADSIADCAAGADG